VEVARSDNLRLTWQNTSKQKLMFITTANRVVIARTTRRPSCLRKRRVLYHAGPIGLAPGHLDLHAHEQAPHRGRLFAAPVPILEVVPIGGEPRYRSFHNGDDYGLHVRGSPSILNQSENDQYNARASMSYVTGSHHYKVGFSIFEGGPNNTTTRTDGGLTYTFRSGVPISLTEFVSPIGTNPINWPAYGLFAQDQWTIKRLTVNYGLRFDNNSEYVAAQHHQAVPQFGIAARNFPRVNCVPCWKDYNPRLAAVYDLLGTGKTALKASISRYVVAESTTIAAANDPINASINSVTRPWTPTNAPVNGLYVPNCDLTNPNPNGDCGRYRM